MKKLCYVVTISITIKAFFIKQLQYLAQHGCEVAVICSSDGNLQSLLGNNIHYVPLDMPRGINITGSIKSIIRLKKIFDKEKFDLIQYSTPNAAFYSSIASRLAGIKIRNYHLMGLRFEGAQGSIKLFLHLMEKVTCTLSTHIECVSRSGLRSSLDYKLFPPKKGIVVFNGSTGGVDLKKFCIDNKKRWEKEIRTSLKIPEKSIVYGFIGRITKDKGIDELLEAFQKISYLQNNIWLLVVGDFEERQKLNPRLLSWAENTQKVIFVKKVNDIERYYAALDVLVLPSYREGFGNVVIEAEAMGVPVIVSNIPGPIDAMISGKTGLTIKVKDSDTLYLAMNKMLENSIRDTYGKNAYEFVIRNFDSNILCHYILKRKNYLLGV